jgi:hypothetical protein
MQLCDACNARWETAARKYQQDLPIWSERGCGALSAQYKGLPLLPDAPRQAIRERFKAAGCPFSVDGNDGQPGAMDIRLCIAQTRFACEAHRAPPTCPY